MAIGEGISDEEVFAAIKKNIEDIRELWDEVLNKTNFYLKKVFFFFMIETIFKLFMLCGKKTFKC